MSPKLSIVMAAMQARLNGRKEGCRLEFTGVGKEKDWDEGKLSHPFLPTLFPSNFRG